MFSSESRRLRCQQLEDGHSGGRERVRREAVFQVQQPQQSRLLEERQAEHRPCGVLANVLISREWVLPGRIVQENAFLGPEDVLKNRAPANPRR